MRAPMGRSTMAEVLVGVLLGGAFGYLSFSASGRRLVDQLDGWLDDASEQMRRLQETAARARETIEESRRVVRVINDVADDMRRHECSAVPPVPRAYAGDAS
jgi:hypothetical protein